MFTITGVKATKPPTYTTVNTLGEPVQGPFTSKSYSRVCRKTTVSSTLEGKIPSASKVEMLQQCVQCVDITSRSGAAMDINKQYAWQSGVSGSRENNPPLPGNVRGLLLERVDVVRKLSSSIFCYHPTGWITITCMFLEIVSTSRSTRGGKKDLEQA